jgi:hypothetical protein
LGEAAVVRLVEVVRVDVALEVALEAGEADVQVAGERGSPAFLEDESVEGFDGAVGLRAAGADQRMAALSWSRVSLKSVERNSPPLSLRIRSSRQPACASSAQTHRASFEV